MDCNSYSYTAPGFGVEDNPPLLKISNDDMQAELTRHATYFSVWAYSYDGQLDVYETFNTENAARTLYNHIMYNYTTTPPDRRTLNKAIRNAHREDNNHVH